MGDNDYGYVALSLDSSLQPSIIIVMCIEQCTTKTD